MTHRWFERTVRRDTLPSTIATDCRDTSVWLLNVQVLLLIVGNSVVLAAHDPKQPSSGRNAVLDSLGQVFTMLFTVEVSIKVIAR